MTNLELPIENLRFVGPKNLKRLHNLGIKTVKDLLSHFPHRYDDFSKIMPIGDIEIAGQPVSIMAEITGINVVRAWRRRMTIINALAADDSGSIRVVWFNQPYIADRIKPGTFVSLSGKVSLDKKGLYLSSPLYERIDSSDRQNQTGRLVPIYPETEGITSKYIRFLMKQALP